MSSFNDRIAMFQNSNKNNSSSNNSNKTNSNINKSSNQNKTKIESLNKFKNEVSKIAEKFNEKKNESLKNNTNNVQNTFGKNIEKKKIVNKDIKENKDNIFKNNKETINVNNFPKKNSIPINDIENNKIEINNHNNIKKNLSIFENKEKNNVNKNINVNNGLKKEEKNIKENNSKINSIQKNIISSLNKIENSQNLESVEKKEISNKKESNNNYISNSNNLKNRLNIFESKGKDNESKNTKKTPNKEKESESSKENKEKIKYEKKNINNNKNIITQKIKSIEILEKPDKSSNESLKRINIAENRNESENKYDIKSLINKLNNPKNQKNDNNDSIIRKSQMIKSKPIQIKNFEFNKSNIESNQKKNLDDNDKDLFKQKINKSNKIMENKNQTKEKLTDIKNNNEIPLKIDLNKNIEENIKNPVFNPVSKTPKKFENSSAISNIISKEKEPIIISDNEMILSKKLYPESTINDTFCMAFFISSFNLKQPKMMENSEELVADCGHIFCSSLPAITPEIIMRYPEKDTKDFEISDLGASICFPNGIKICFDKNEMHVNGLKNYSSMLTNQVGKRYYISTYHFFLKCSYEEFMNEVDYGNNIDQTLLQAIRVKDIYIPYCVSLFSKYPYFNQMEKCLESLRFTIANYKTNPNEIYELLIYLIKSIPVPKVGTSIQFPLPYCPELILINQPFYKDIILFGDNPSIILEYLSVEEIILILRLLLFEQKILLVGNNYDAISQLIFNFSLLLYPMQWVHTFIPILSQKMLKYLDSFLPFFDGIHITLYELISGILSNIKENIFIFDFNKHNFEMNTFPTLNSKNIMKKINDLVPSFPKNVLNNLTFGLGVVKSYYEQTKKNKKNINPEENMVLNIKIKQVFFQAFIEILYDYKTYLSIVNEKPIFNTKIMLEKKPKADYKFYKELTETQLFQVFIQNNPVNKKANTFFEEQLDIYENLKDKKDFKDEYINNFNITCEISENYLIGPDILDNFDIKNQKKINKIKLDDLTPNEYKKYLKKKYFVYDTYFKPKSILKFNKLIIKEKFCFDINNISSEIYYYIMPNVKFNFEEKRRKSKFNTNMKKIQTESDKELTPELKDEIRENITDVITKIFKNDEISDPDEYEKLILDSLNTDYGKDLYVNTLYKNKNILYKESFEFLEKLIVLSLNKILSSKIAKDKKLFYALRLIKCCDNFTKEEKSLDDFVYPKLDKIQIINEENFWKEYANLYIKDNTDKNMDKSDRWIECLNKIEEIMPLMGLKKTMIYTTLASLGKDNIEGNKFSKLMKDIIQRLDIYKV